MGAFVGAMAALGWPPEAMIETCHRELSRRAPFSDYTFPRHALIRARRAASMLDRVFGDAALEQLAWPLFTVSADLLSSRMVIHRTGSVIEAVGSSMAIPGLAPPVLRRSELLVDGGVLNNLPIDVMVGDEPGPVVAVDVMRRLESDDLGTYPAGAPPDDPRDALPSDGPRKRRAGGGEPRAGGSPHHPGRAGHLATRLQASRASGGRGPPGGGRGARGRRQGSAPAQDPICIDRPGSRLGQALMPVEGLKTLILRCEAESKGTDGL